MNAREKILKLRSRVDSAYVPTLQRAYFRWFGHWVDQRFIIVGNARTGSNYLLDGLKSSPAIRMYHEVFASHNREVGKDFAVIAAEDAKSGHVHPSPSSAVARASATALTYLYPAEAAALEARLAADLASPGTSE